MGCSVRSPGDGAAISGAEPGTQFAVVVQAAASASNGLDDVDLPVRVSVAVDGRGYIASQGPDGNFTAQCRTYDSGVLTLTATATAAAFGSSKSAVSTVHVQASLQLASPSLTVNEPSSGSPVGLGENGADVPVTVTMADANLFGGHTVVVQPDLGAPVGLALSAGSTSRYAGIVHLTAMPLGERSLTVTGTCAGTTLASTATLTVVGADVAPPSVRVIHPAFNGPAAAIASATDPTAFTVSISGETSDPQSGMVGGQASVAVALAAGGPRITARPGRRDDWTTWTVDALPLPAPSAPPAADTASLGTFPLFVWATDAAGNTTPAPLAWGFEAIHSWVPATLEERLSPLEYLRDLIRFTGEQVRSASPVRPPLDPISAPVSPAQLAAVLGQPLDAISQPATPAAAAAQVAINELRVPIEILRTGLADGQITASAAGQAAYLTAAYQMLLAGLGTSYTELRVARGADPGDRGALAARIGIPLYGLAAAGAGPAPSGRPDQLDALTLDGPALTEQALQDLFGLTTTTPFDPQHLPPSQSSPTLLGWQVEALGNLWQSRDARPPAPVAYTVIVDPDIITPADVRAGSPQSAQVLNLLAARAAQLAGQANTLNAARTAAATAADGGFSALLAAGLPAGVDITALRTQDTQGIDIREQLAVAGLDRTGFGYLVQLQTLAASAGFLITASEWADAVDVLVGAFRRRQYAAWTAPDPATGTSAEAGIVLSPDTFQVTDDPPPAGPLRISPTARRDWQATVRARTVQRQALQDAMSELVAAAEHAALPVLRDGLLAEIAGPQGDLAAAGEQITKRYQIDVLVSGALTTTRLDQAITSLQALVLLVRSGDSAKIDPFTSWTLSATNAYFDAAWSWIGTLSSWRSATTTFLFPEAALDPSLLAAAAPAKGSLFSGAFTSLCDALSGGPGLDVSGPINDYVNGAPKAAPPMTGARALLQNVLGTAAQDFDYPKTRSTDAQAGLAAMSGMLDGSVPHSGGTDPNLALEVFWAVPMLLAQRLHADGHYQAALDWLWIAFPYTDDRAVSAYDVINNEIATDAAQPDLTLTDWTAFDPYALITGRPYPHLRATLLAIISCLLDYADSEFATETGESIAHARNLYRTVADQLTHPRLEPVTPSDPGDAALPIPQLAVLKARAGNQLAKIRQDRNIAGLPRTQTISSGDPIRQPTPYHFKVLLARAQQLAQQATTLEGEYLSALEKYDNKTLQLADAQNASGVAAAQLTVHDAQVQQATDAFTAAHAQQTKTTTMVSTYTSAISGPPNQYEQNLFTNYDDMRSAQDAMAAGDLMVAIGQAASMSVEGFGTGSIGAAIQNAGATTKSIGQLKLNDFTQSMERNQLRASIEDRKQEWRIQLASAQQDELVAAAQVTTANDQVKIATAERTVAGLQAAAGDGEPRPAKGSVHEPCHVQMAVRHPRRGVPVLPAAGHRHRRACAGAAGVRARRTGPGVRPQRLLAAPGHRPAQRRHPGADRRRTSRRRSVQARPVRFQHRQPAAEHVADLLPRGAGAGGVPRLPRHRADQLRHPGRPVRPGLPRPLPAADPPGPAQRGRARAAEPRHPRHPRLVRHLPGHHREQRNVRRGAAAPRPQRRGAHLTGGRHRRVRRRPAAGHAAAVRGQRRGHHLGAHACRRPRTRSTSAPSATCC